MQQVYDYGMGQVVGLQPNYQAMIDVNRAKADSMTSGYKDYAGLAARFAEQLRDHQNQVNTDNAHNLRNMAQQGNSIASNQPIYQTMVDANSMKTLTNGRPSTKFASDIIAAQDANFDAPTVVANKYAQPTVVAKPVRGQGVVRDPAVVALQERLNASGAKLKVDGIYGPKTQQARFEESNKAAPEVIAFKSGDRPAYVPGPIQQETNMSNQVPNEGLAAKANGLDESVAYWLNGDANGQAPEGYIPTARYNSFSDMFK